MKNYQSHDELQDQGKAEPRPKRPTSETRRGWFPVRLIKNHSDPLYATAQRHRLNGTVANIRIDCCRNGHLFKLTPTLDNPSELPAVS